MPAAIASSVLPVPAEPISETSLTESSSSRSSAIVCCRFRGMMPKTGPRRGRTGTSAFRSGRYRASAVCDRRRSRP